MTIHTPQANDVAAKTVLVRVDYNVPLKEGGGFWQIADDQRIKASIKTIEFLVENKAKIILMSHLGRPKSTKDKKFSLKPVADYLKYQLKLDIKFAPDCIGQVAQTAAQALKPSQILLLENLRFHAEEKQNDKNFASQLASLAQVYINEAFSNSHRAHASMVGVPALLPHFAGFALKNEVENLKNLMISPKRPFVVVIGGAKISDKVEAVKNLSRLADIILVGGGVANNFLKADGIEVHKSFLQDVSSDLNKKNIDYVKVADKLMTKNRTEKILKDGYIPLPKILYPTDVIAAKPAVMANKNPNVPAVEETQLIDLYKDYKDTPDDEDLMYLDIGPKTIRLYQEVIMQAGTIFWNGPMGVFEKNVFSRGTSEIARTIAKSGAMTVLGGGDTIAAIKKFGLNDRYDYVSAAGGASLDLLAGKKLPGLEGVKRI